LDKTSTKQNPRHTTVSDDFHKSKSSLDLVDLIEKFKFQNPATNMAPYTTDEDKGRKEKDHDKKELKKNKVKKSKKRKSLHKLASESQPGKKDNSKPVPLCGDDDETKNVEIETTSDNFTHKITKQETVTTVHVDVGTGKRQGDKDNAHNGGGSTNDCEDGLQPIKKSNETIDKSERRKLRREARASLKAKKKEMKKSLLSEVPKVDKDGISYTKIQIRRMMRRVKIGLPPVPTEKEENERRRLIKLEKMEEEEELAGMIGADEDEGADDDEGTDDEGAIDEFGRKLRDSGRKVIGAAIDREERKNASLLTTSRSVGNGGKEPLKKKRRTKPVPADYICQACKNEYSPPHWIYDCPYKIRIPGNGEVAKKFRGINDPVSRKVFISGLPFDVKPNDVETYFESKVIGGKVMHCKLFLFDDTKRCKGQGIVTFGTDESAKKALKLNGTILTSESFNKKKKKVKDGNSQEKKISLRLGVTKLLNRIVTKNKKE